MNLLIKELYTTNLPGETELATDFTDLNGFVRQFVKSMAKKPSLFDQWRP